MSLEQAKQYHQQLCIIVIIAIFFVMFLHILDITEFASKYAYYFNYGNSLKGLCSNEYFEFETARFQVASNMKDIKISGEKEKKYNTMIFIICILVSFWLSILFAKFINDTFLNIFNRLSKDSSEETSFSKIVKDVIKNKLFCYFSSALKIVILLSVVFWVFIYLAIIFTTGNNQSLFSKTVYSSYIFYILIIAIILQLISFAIGQDKADDNSKKYTDLVSFGWTGLFTYTVFIVFYICMFYILGSVVQIIRFPYDQKQREENLRKLDDTSVNISNTFFENVLGYKNTQVFFGDNNYIYIESISGVFSTVCIIFVIMLALFGILKFYEIIQEKDELIFMYGILIPCLMLIAVLYVGSNVTEYNNILNKYVLYDPINYYKEYINDLNNMFNNTVLAVDYNKITDTKRVYVCRNYGNGILNVLYAHLFNQINNIDVTPEFKYEKNCDNIFLFEFHKGKEYQISYYLNSKQLKKSIFFKYDKCDDINLDVIDKIGSNVFAEFSTTKQSCSANSINNICKAIYDDVSSSKTNMHNVPTIDILRDNYSDKIRKIDIDSILVALSNINKNLIYNATTEQQNSIRYVNDKSSKTTILEAHNKNNKLYFDFTKKYMDNDHEINKYRALIEEKVLRKYENMCYELLYAYAELNVLQNGIYGKPFVTKITNIIKKYFDNIVKNLSTPVEIQNGSITKYIISNYNSVVDEDKMYKDRIFKINDRQYNKINPDNQEVKLTLQFCSNIGIIKSDIYPMLKLDGANSTYMSNIIRQTTNNINTYKNYDITLTSNIIENINKYYLPNLDITAYNIANDIMTNTSTLNDANTRRMLIESSVNKNDLPATKSNIELYKQKIEPNLDLLYSDCMRYVNKNDIKHVVEETFNKSKKKAQAITANARAANDLMYFIIFTYIVVLVCAILFVYIK